MGRGVREEIYGKAIDEASGACLQDFLAEGYHLFWSPHLRCFGV